MTNEFQRILDDVRLLREQIGDPRVNSEDNTPTEVIEPVNLKTQKKGIFLTILAIGILFITLTVFVLNSAEKDVKTESINQISTVISTQSVKICSNEDYLSEEGDCSQQSDPLTFDAKKGDDIDEPEHLLCPTELFDPQDIKWLDCISSTYQLGASPYWQGDVSSPTAFVNQMLGKSFDEGFGAQCVAGFKEFTYSISGRVVATSTGGASGYANQQGQIAQLGGDWHAGTTGIKNGDWAIFGGSTYGHVAMYYNGKWFGQNQLGGNIYVGSSFSLVSNVGLPVLGYYRWEQFTDEHEPQPAPQPQPDEHAGLTWFYYYQFIPYTGQRDYLFCREYGNGGCWAS